MTAAKDGDTRPPFARKIDTTIGELALLTPMPEAYAELLMGCLALFGLAMLLPEREVRDLAWRLTRTATEAQFKIEVDGAKASKVAQRLSLPKLDHDSPFKGPKVVPFTRQPGGAQ